MCVVLVFPALCIYDKARHRQSCCCRCHCCRKTEAETHENSHHHIVEDKESFIRRTLARFYNFLHRFRWVSLIVCTAAILLAIIFGSKIGLPTSSDVRLLSENKSQYERNFQWRLNLLYDVLLKKSGSTAYVVWGTTPADTGDINNPASFSQLVLDDSFDPSSEAAQVYMRDFCDRFFANGWAEPVSDNCPINVFDMWLQDQAASAAPDDIYVEYCGGATALPVAPSDFDECIYEWGQQTGDLTVLARNRKVEIMFVPFGSRVRYDSPYDTLDAEWKEIEQWMGEEDARGAPNECANGYHTSDDFWW